MKTKLILVSLLACVTIGFAADQIRRTGAGLVIGEGATDKIGFFGATPVAKQAGVTNAPAVLATLTKNSATITYLGVDGSTNSVSVITNVTINAIAGVPSTNTVNAIVNTLRNLGLAGN